jgi:hypothetical protein
MKKFGLLVLAAIPTLIIAGCTTWWTKYKCPAWSEYRENTYEDWTLESQWCFKIESDVMEWHWIYYFENWGKDMEWDIVDDLAQWLWKFYDEDGNNIVVMEWNYKDDEEDGEWKYYDNSWKYVCSEVYEDWEFTDEWDCEFDEEYYEEYDEKDDIE